MGEVRGRGREWAENGEGMKMRKMGLHEKSSHKTQQIWHWGRTLKATAPFHAFLSHVSTLTRDIDVADL